MLSRPILILLAWEILLILDMGHKVKVFSLKLVLAFTQVFLPDLYVIDDYMG